MTNNIFFFFDKRFLSVFFFSGYYNSRDKHAVKEVKVKGDHGLYYTYLLIVWHFTNRLRFNFPKSYSKKRMLYRKEFLKNKKKWITLQQFFMHVVRVVYT